MPRRDAFSMLRGASSPTPVTEPTSSNPTDQPLEPRTIKPLDFIPAAEKTGTPMGKSTSRPGSNVSGRTTRDAPDHAAPGRKSGRPSG